MIKVGGSGKTVRKKIVETKFAAQASPIPNMLKIINSFLD